MATQKENLHKEIRKIRAVYFSPTGSTRKIVRAFCGTITSLPPVDSDLTLPGCRNASIPPVKEDLLVLGFPVYEEKIPDHMTGLLKQLEGSNTPAVILAIYGGVDYGVSLQQAGSILEKTGFIVIGAGAFVAEHSFATAFIPLAVGRPDDKDLRGAADFGRKILEHYTSGTGAETTIPGHLSLQARILPPGSTRFFAHAPILDPSLCTACNTCVAVCPNAAVDPHTYRVNDKLCIRCFACVKYCPQGARYKKLKKEWIVKPMLNHHARRRKEPEYFLL